jgi:hypothetical protein
VPGGGLFELGHLRTQDEALAAEDGFYRCHHFGTDFGIFPGEIQQGNREGSRVAGSR